MRPIILRVQDDFTYQDPAGADRLCFRLVMMFDRERRLVRQLGGKGRVRLQTRIGIVVDDQDRLFVSDADLNHVFCFDGDGEILLALGRKEGLSNPTGLAFDRQRHRLSPCSSSARRATASGQVTRLF